MRIIIDSTDKRMTVPLIDYLAQAGYEVHGVCFSGDRPLNREKLARTHYISRPNTTRDLSEIFAQYDSGDILIAGNPDVIEAVNSIRPRLKYLLSARESVAKAINKKELCAFAAGLGLRVPKEFNEPRCPMIVKLNISENAHGKPAERYRIIRDGSELEAARPFITRNAGNLIMQEYVEGPSVGVSMLLDGESNLVDYIVHERLLEYPVTGGPSAACRSIVNTPLAEQAYRLLRALGWKGIAMVEFKGGALIEINPRFWGSMPLLFTSKSDFFGNYIKALYNRHTVITPELLPYRPNKTIVYFPQGLLSVLSLLKSGKIRKAASGLKILILGKEGIFRLSNPRPFFRYLRTLIRRNSV